MSDEPIISKTVTVQASILTVWHSLITPELMKLWMADTDMSIEVETTWRLHDPILIGGYVHQIPFENRGTVRQFSPPYVLAYSHLSSLSNLPDIPVNHTVITFQLADADNGTTLTLIVRNFPTESIYRHLALYWTTTLDVLKSFVEREGGDFQ